MFSPFLFLETGQQFSDQQKFDYSELFNQLYIGWLPTSQASPHHLLCTLLVEDCRWMLQTEQEQGGPKGLMPGPEYWFLSTTARDEAQQNPQCESAESIKSESSCLLNSCNAKSFCTYCWSGCSGMILSRSKVMVILRASNVVGTLGS